MWHLTQPTAKVFWVCAMWLALWTILFFAGQAPCAAIAGPDKVEANTPAWYTITDMPAGAEAVWMPSNQLQVDSRYLKPGVALFWANAEGVYPINGLVVAVTIDWNTQTHSLTLLPVSKQVIVGAGPTPPDPPDPPNPIDQKYQVVMFYESNDVDNYPRGQQLLLNSLEFRKRLAAAGHLLMPGGVCDIDFRNSGGSVPAALEPFYKEAKDDPMPRLVIAPLEGGKVMDFPLPANEAALFTLLEQPAGTLYRIQTLDRKPIPSASTQVKPKTTKPKYKWIYGGPGMKVQVPYDYCPTGQCP